MNTKALARACLAWYTKCRFLDWTDAWNHVEADGTAYDCHCLREEGAWHVSAYTTRLEEDGTYTTEVCGGPVASWTFPHGKQKRTMKPL